jgi:hypothetical protein
MSLRRQRIENEWSVLLEMAQANPACITLKARSPDEFLLVLRETAAPLYQNHKIELVREHEFRFSFARFFPAVPIEAYLTFPAFHPNVHPTTGFVCLWARSSKADTVFEAVCQLQRILSYSVFSGSPNDVVQPEALTWAMNANRGIALPLSFNPIVKPAAWSEQQGFQNPRPRRRLF